MDARATVTIEGDDDAGDDRDTMQAPRRMARGLLDAGTELWAGGFRVMGAFLQDLGDSIARPRTVRRRSTGAPAGEGRAGETRTSDRIGGMVENYADSLDAILTSVSNGIGGVASTMQRSLNRMSNAVAPPEDRDEDSSATRRGQSPAGSKSPGAKGPGVS
jgi:hypothetical protein